MKLNDDYNVCWPTVVGICVLEYLEWAEVEDLFKWLKNFCKLIILFISGDK